MVDELNNAKQETNSVKLGKALWTLAHRIKSKEKRGKTCSTLQINYKVVSDMRIPLYRETR